MEADVATGKDLEVCLTQALDACACIQPAAGSPLIRRANDRDGRRSITMSNAPEPETQRRPMPSPRSSRPLR